MTTDEAIEILDKIRIRWGADLDQQQYIAWRAELLLVDADGALQALSHLKTRRPHQRPTIADFTEELHTITNPFRLSPAQIAVNLAGIARIREQLAERKPT